jgi:hypothetical protein
VKSRGDASAHAAPLPAWPAKGAPAPAWGAFLTALSGYLAITLALFWPVVRHIASCFPADLGDPPNESWLVAWTVHALTTDPSALLQGNIYYPHANALIYNDSLLGLLPLSTPVYLLDGGNAALTYNVMFLLSFILCGAFTYLLAFHLTGSRAGAFLAGLIVAFCPYRMGHLGHLNQLSGQWLPLALLFWERARAAASGGKRMWPDLCGLVLSYALLALCSIYYAAFLGICLVIYLAAYLRHAGWQRARRFLGGLALAGTTLLILLLPVFIPYLRLQSRVASVRGRDQVLYFAADLRDFLRMPPTSLIYGWTERALGVPAGDAVQYLFPGMAALALAAIAWQQRPQVWEIRAYALVGGTAAILALGLQLKLFDRLYLIPLPYALLYDHLSLFHGFRDTARFSFVGIVALALLAAWGVATLQARLPAGSMRGRAIGTLLAALVLAEYWIAPLPAPRVPTGAAIPAVYHWLKEQPPDTPVLELPIGQQNVRIWSQQALMTYYATYHWQPIVNGLGGYTPAGYEADATVLNRWPDGPSSRLLRRWGVRYVIWHPEWTGKGQPPGARQLTLIRRFADGIQVYAVRPIRGL